MPKRWSRAITARTVCTIDLTWASSVTGSANYTILGWRSARFLTKVETGFGLGNLFVKLPIVRYLSRESFSVPIVDSGSEVLELPGACMILKVALIGSSLGFSRA